MLNSTQSMFVSMDMTELFDNTISNDSDATTVAQKEKEFYQAALLLGENNRNRAMKTLRNAHSKKDKALIREYIDLQHGLIEFYNNNLIFMQHRFDVAVKDIKSLR